MIVAKTEEYNSHQIATFRHDAESKNIVIFCHGYRGTSVGPNRFFVRVAQKLEGVGISSIRFDQFGSGNSEGDFFDSTFTDWVVTTKAIAQDYLNKGYKVALFGQSMGATTVIVTGAELPEVTAVVAWVPDPNIEDFNAPDTGYIEESGQRVQVAYWQQAHEAKVADRLAELRAPALIIQCTDDEFVDESNRQAIQNNAQHNHQVVSYEGHKHSSWTYEQAEEIIARSIDFIVQRFDE